MGWRHREAERDDENSDEQSQGVEIAVHSLPMAKRHDTADTAEREEPRHEPRHDTEDADDWDATKDTDEPPDEKKRRRGCF